MESCFLIRSRTGAARQRVCVGTEWTQTGSRSRAAGSVTFLSTGSVSVGLLCSEVMFEQRQPLVRLHAAGISPSSTRLVTRSYGSAARTDAAGLGFFAHVGGGGVPLSDMRWLTIVGVTLIEMYLKENMHFMDVNMETIGCQVWINVPVCPEQLVALPESVVEKHIDPFEGQLCVVDGLRLCLLQAPRRSVGWGRHWDTLQGGTGGVGWGGCVRSVKLLYSNAQASRPVTQFFAANAAMFTTLCQPANERSRFWFWFGFGRCSVCCRCLCSCYWLDTHRKRGALRGIGIFNPPSLCCKHLGKNSVFNMWRLLKIVF